MTNVRVVEGLEPAGGQQRAGSVWAGAGEDGGHGAGVGGVGVGECAREGAEVHLRLLRGALAFTVVAGLARTHKVLPAIKAALAARK